MNTENMGKQIAMFRKERGLTQDALADILNISAQAISKWENGHSLPDTALLPGIAAALDCTIDSLFMMSSLVILEAWFGDGLERRNVTTRLTRYIENDELCIIASPNIFGGAGSCGRVLYLTVKYRGKNGVCCACAKQNETLNISASDEACAYETGALEIIAASYGNFAMNSDVMKQIKHYSVFNWDSYPANDEYFPSDPMNDSPEYLTIVYTNCDGIHTVTCEEGEKIAYSADRTNLFRKSADEKSEFFIPGIEYLPPFRKGMECSLIASLAAAAKAMGINTSYERLMGESGACFIFAFTSPQWDYSASDGIMPFNYTEAAYKALGYACEQTGMINKRGREAERRKITDSIRRGVPVLAINLRVDNAWGLICGFRENGGGVDLFCRTKYDLETETRNGLLSANDSSDNYARVDNWPSNLIYFSRLVKRSGARENLMRSLGQFADYFTSERHREYYLGRLAFEKLYDDLTRDEWYEVSDDAQFARRLSVAQFMFMCLKDARRAACVYLKECRGAVNRIESSFLEEIISIYTEIYSITDELFKMIDTPIVLEGEAARHLWTVQKRHSQAELVKELTVLETKAFNVAEKMVDLMKS